MWYIQCLIMTAIVSVLFIGLPFIHYKIEDKPSSGRFGKKSGWIAVSVVFAILFTISSLVGWGCHADTINKYNKFLSMYEKAVEPCIEEESLNYYTVNCNIAYQLERYDFTIEDYNDWVKYYGKLDTDWFEKYSGINLPAYIKVINVNGSCLCDGNSCGTVEDKP